MLTSNLLAINTLASMRLENQNQSFSKKPLRICKGVDTSYEESGTPLQYSAWKIPWTEAPGRLQSMGSLRIEHNWVTSLSVFSFLHWRRKWQPTPGFLPGESQGQGSLAGCRLWGHTESDTTEATSQQWLVMLSTFSCASRPSKCLLCKNLYLGLMPTFDWLVLLTLSYMSC